MHARATVAAIALGAALSLSGCALTADITTSQAYDPSDGSGVVVGDVTTQNLLLVTSGVGEPSVLIGTLYNGGNDDATVTVAVAGTAAEVTIDPMSSVTLGLGDDATAIVVAAPAAPGSLATVSVSVTQQASQALPVPVVDGTLEEYQAVLDLLDGVEIPASE